jgi:hypothetical protein
MAEKRGTRQILGGHGLVDGCMDRLFVPRQPAEPGTLILVQAIASMR